MRITHEYRFDLRWITVAMLGFLGASLDPEACNEQFKLQHDALRSSQFRYFAGDLSRPGGRSGNWAV
jgi:hypothetical protein